MPMRTMLSGMRQSKRKVALETSSAEGCDGRDLDYRVEVLADGFLYAGDLICGEGVEQLLADGLWVDD